MSLEEIKLEVEGLIRGGQRDQARAVLQKLKGKKIPRARSCEMADLARRAGLLPLALQIMMPILRPKVPLDTPPTNQEISCYAIILLGFAASLEALELLESGDPDDLDILLAKAFAYMNRWDYQSATEHLRRYLELGAKPSHKSKVSPYQLMIAKVNLAASLVATAKTQEGKTLINEILQVTFDEQWNLLHKNSLEIGSQLAIQDRDWRLASDLLKRASEQSEGVYNTDDVFVKKWKAIALIEKEGATPEALAALSQIQSEAARNGHWETIRDCDYHKALALKDEKLFLQVYFGTPFQSYRDRIAKRAEGWIKIPSTYVRQMNSEPSNRVFDLIKGEESLGPAKLKPGKSLFNALSTLVSDFYRPFVIGNLHAAVFPGEHFNPISSPRRISFLLHRLRDWFQENEMPLQIEFSKEGYRLKSEGPYAFQLVPLGQDKAQSQNKTEGDPAHYVVMINKLREEWPATPFTAIDVASRLGISERSARYFIRWALERNQLHRLGSGRSTQYKMAA